MSLQIFLSTYNFVKRSVKCNKQKPGWVTTYNLCSLLNAPRSMDEFGPLVDLWEGKVQGEGILKYIKKELRQGTRHGWQARLLLKLLERKALSAVMGSLENWVHHGMVMDEEADCDDAVLRGDSAGKGIPAVTATHVVEFSPALYKG